MANTDWIFQIGGKGDLCQELILYKFTGICVRYVHVEDADYVFDEQNIKQLVSTSS